MRSIETVDLSQVNRTIHPDDEAFAFARLNGKTVDQFLENAKKLALVLGGLVEKYRPALLSGARFLDYGCGHGRLARYFPLLFEPASFHVADVWDSGVQFCAEQFGATPVLVENGQSIIRTGQKFDVINVVSVFSHLPPPRFYLHLNALSTVLDPNGILVFTYVPISDAADRGVTVAGEYYFGLPRGKNNTTAGRLSSDEYALMAITDTFLNEALAQTGLKPLEFGQTRDNRQFVAVVEPA
jgi:2-polyprenyl-3-methyl-5-hydroxy-6-metoxy-1,4-benzoquinol methylase